MIKLVSDVKKLKQSTRSGHYLKIAFKNEVDKFRISLFLGHIMHLGLLLFGDND